MYIAYSALRPQITGHAETKNIELQIRYRAYLDACSKHRRYISEIQKYIPGWTPRFR